MKSVRKALKKALILSIFLSVAFIVGIPAIVFGACNRLWLLMAFGITLTVIGFYGMPIAWIYYGGVRNLERLVYTITEEHIYTVQALSEHLSVSEKETRNRLEKCLRKMYLQGYSKNGDNIVLNDEVPLNKKQFSAACPNCGAKFFYTLESPRCPYCNSPVKQDK